MTRIIQRLAYHVDELQVARERIIYFVEEERRNGKEIQRDVLNWLENLDELIERANQVLKYHRRANVRGSTWRFSNLILRHQLSRNATKIGVYGLGGVGKTTLVDEVVITHVSLSLWMKVRLPIGNEHNCYKLFMASRNHDVLLQMDVPKRDVHSWKDALRKLQSYSALELGYNSLESDEMRNIFLLLALMQGNDVEYTLKVAMSLEILKHVNTVDDARNRFYTIIISLEGTGLLLGVKLGGVISTQKRKKKVGGVIQMHDFVRDFAISIAHMDKPVFLSKNPHEEWAWPTKDFLKRCTQIALSDYQKDELFPLVMQDNNVEYFPDDQLSVLSYQPSFISEEDDYQERLDLLIRSNNHSLCETQKVDEQYQERLDLLIRSNNHSLCETQKVDEQEVDGETRLSLWVDVAGGMSQGQRYSTSAMHVNLRPSVSHLTQESSPPENEGIEMLRREVAAARAEAVAANERAVEANQRADVSDQHIQFLENNMAEFAQRMTTLENQSSAGSCNTS